MKRILGIVVGLAAIVFGGLTIYGYFNPSLPACDASDTQTNMRQIVMIALGDSIKADEAEKVKSSIGLSEMKEVSYDKDKEIRECTATVDLTVGTDKTIDKQKIAYTITWQNKDDKMFYVQFHEVK